MYFSLEVCPRDGCGTLRGLHEKEREVDGGEKRGVGGQESEERGGHENRKLG